MNATVPSAVGIRELDLAHITQQTPMGGNLLPDGGATFRVWAPRAREVSVRWGYVKRDDGSWAHTHEGRLTQTDNGIWAGYVRDISENARYMFHVNGPEGGTEGLKRDPYARDLTDDPVWPQCQCLLYNPDSFPWHDHEWKPPQFHELCIYQLHIGTWYIPVDRHVGTFLDVITKLPYLKSLGINTIQPLPIVEFPTMYSLGYNGVDYFSPETDYGVKDTDPDLDRYLASVNELLGRADPSLVPYEKKDVVGTANQFRMMVDMCHVYDIGVVLDVVYNHAGGDFGDKSMYFLDRKPYGDHNDSLYFTDRGWAGGLVFAYWNAEVRQFLINNAAYFLTECHCDGFRYDEVSVIKNEGGANGWLFCQHVTDTCHYVKPEAIHIAECWPVEQAVVAPTWAGGAGFDAAQNDGLREAIRAAVSQASSGAHAVVDIDRIARELRSPKLSDGWRAVQCSENHDIVRQGRGARIPRLADGGDSHSWHARSRSRVAMGLVATSVGIPHLFMGQEFLEDKPWHDEPNSPYQIWWEGLEYDKTMIDFLHFTRDLLNARRSLPALQGGEIHVYHQHNQNRTIAFHRWIVGKGMDIVVVANLQDWTWHGYQIGFPIHGYWREVFNSDAYDNWVNPVAAGNGGGVYAHGGPMHGLPASANIVIPANSILIFSR